MTKFKRPRPSAGLDPMQFDHRDPVIIVYRSKIDSFVRNSVVQIVVMTALLAAAAVIRWWPQ